MRDDVQFIGQSAAFQDAVEQAAAAAMLDRPVLVVGERGTGKELVAERLHRLSPRWDKPYVVMNCAALPETLIEAELFGHEAGAFTGATRARAGRFEEADGGTLFLDELGTLSLGAQERLLRAVEYGELARVGSSRPLRVDVRIVAATNADLPAMAAADRFRADLLDRLSFEVISLPPLRVREGDVAELANHFGRRMAAELGWPHWPGFAVGAMAALEAYPWPGNVRELRNVAERAVYRWGSDPARAGTPVGAVNFNPFASAWPAAGGTGNDSAWPAAGGGTARAAAEPDRAAEPPARPTAVPDIRAAVAAYEREILVNALARSRHNQRQAAALVGLGYDQFRHALKRHGLRGNRAD